jgi:tetratricopeptide (TPR) repeat protein
MNRTFFSLCLLTLPALGLYAQQPDSKTLQETAKTFTRQGDYANAIVVLAGASQKDPQNLDLQKDLAFNYYLQKDYAKGLNVARALTERTDADAQCYQLAGLFYKAVDESKECEKLYKAGIKRFPKSGVMYSEYGEMLLARQDNTGAIHQWEKGIESDPGFSTNYYYACKYYDAVKDNKAWSLIYGEIFVNLESYSKRTAEIKDILMDGYKSLFAEGDLTKDQNLKSPFAAAWLNTMSQQRSAVAQGITTASLTLLRTKFILAWFEITPQPFTFRLFDYQRQLLKEGMFDAYNQWLFGAAENLPAFQSWSNTHAEEYNKFTGFQRGRVFHMPEGQYYQVIK